MYSGSPGTGTLTDKFTRPHRRLRQAAYRQGTVRAAAAGQRTPKTQRVKTPTALYCAQLLV